MPDILLRFFSLFVVSTLNSGIMSGIGCLTYLATLRQCHLAGQCLDFLYHCCPHLCHPLVRSPIKCFDDLFTKVYIQFLGQIKG